MQCKATIPVQNQSRVASCLGPSSGLENVEFNRRFLRTPSLIQHCHPEVMFSSSIVSPVTYLSIRLRQAQCQLPSYFIGTDTGTPMASSCPSSPATLVLWKTRRSFLWSGLHDREALVKRRHGRGHATTGRPCQKCFSQPRSTPCRNNPPSRTFSSLFWKLPVGQRAPASRVKRLFPIAHCKMRRGWLTT
ncbi:hypothetical protein TEQG_00283 [Trichophyton equinum CBS 127.97]|uniref:Uncharacterized protein n=1 Tax=Trichophyton equinum (strain ATCC MYA-4606 / CBS 127.97) TaxID=559882 RepID=F2PH62_TRIEC|nr:hypothetical protein TEQG_00283 [Trichophyton equinum CBS 127.97]